MTKRRLLEWETAATAAARAAGLVRKGGLHHFTAEMVASPIAAGVVLAAMIAWRPGAIPAASPILLAWAIGARTLLLIGLCGLLVGFTVLIWSRIGMYDYASRAWFEPMLLPKALKLLTGAG